MVTLTDQAREVRYLTGRRVNWLKPPAASKKMKWTKRTTGGRTVYGSFRSICALNRLNNLAVDTFGTGIQVIQSAYNSTVRASAGTHDLDACYDVYIPGVGWDTAQKFLRAHGFACWVRHPPAFGWHIHGFVLPPHEGNEVGDDFAVAGMKVGLYVDGGVSTRGYDAASSQIDDYYRKRTGLAGHATAPGWYPPDIAATAFNLKAYVARRAKAQRAGQTIGGK